MTGEISTSEDVADVIKVEIRNLDLAAGVIEVRLSLKAPMPMGRSSDELVCRFDAKMAHDLVVQLSQVLWQSEPSSADPWDPWHEGPQGLDLSESGLQKKSAPAQSTATRNGADG